MIALKRPTTTTSAPDGLRSTPAEVGTSGGRRRFRRARASSPALRSLLACPHCGGELLDRDGGLVCAQCAQSYRARDDQPDLRLAVEKLVELPLWVRPLDQLAAGLRRPRPIPLDREGLTEVDPDAYPGRLTRGNGLTRELISWFPRATAAGSVMLDLGCGDRRCEPVCRLAGHEYVGMDIDGEEPDVLGIAEALPFRDESFDFVFSLAVIPHTTQPLVALREARRVLKPGARFIATVQFLEPCFMASRHHVSALGLQDWLSSSGFEVLQLEANHRWTGIHAILQLGYLPRFSWNVNGAIAGGLHGLHRLQTRGARRRAGVGPIGEQVPERVTGGFRFVAERAA